MNLKASFSKGLFKNDIKRFKWMGLAYFLALFFIVPFRMIMINSYSKTSYSLFNYIFNFRNELQVVLIVGVPVLLGVFLLRYLQVRKRNSDFIHSLPIKRESLYLTNIVIGFIVLILPVVLNTLISIILRYTLGIEAYIELNSIYIWTGVMILLNLVIFSITIFTGIITGISSLQGILSFIFIFLPIGLSYLVVYNLERFLYGFKLSNINEQFLNKLSPVVMILSQSIEDITAIQVLSYSIITIILLIISILLYKRRHLETASQSFSFKWVKLIFKYGITFSFMTFGGMYFSETQSKSIIWLLLGYFIGSLIGYIVSEMIIRKSFSIFKYMKGYIVYVIIIGILLVGVKVDIFGYEGYIPEVEKVQSAYFGNNIYNSYYGYEYGYYKKDYKDLGLKTKSNIKLITELHKAIIRNKEKGIKETKSTRNIDILYILENGNKVVRNYAINNEDYVKYLKPLYESKEYKMYYNTLYNPIFKLKSSEIDKLTFRVDNGVNKKVVITDTEEMKEVLEIVKKDILDETYEELNDQKQHWSRIEFLLSDDKKTNVTPSKSYNQPDRFSIAFRKSYDQLEAWLKEKGYYENTRVMPSDISYVRVYESANRESTNEYQVEVETIDTNDLNDKNFLQIKDNGKIEILLRNYKGSWIPEKKYHLEFMDDSERVIIHGVLDEYIPEYIDKYFNK